VPLPEAVPSPDGLRSLFLALYHELYGHADPKGAIEIVTLRTVAIGVMDKPVPLSIHPATGDARPVRHRQVQLRGSTSSWPVYDRAGLGAGHGFKGPAIVEEANATSVVLPGWSVAVDRRGNLKLTREA
jgi:N-methylhydantoinase A